MGGLEKNLLMINGSVMIWALASVYVCPFTLGLVGGAGEPADKADLIVHASRIWTGDTTRPWAESLASRGDRIVAVGSRNEMDKLRGHETTVLDLPGGFATPGLVDAHVHLTSLGETLEQVDLRGAKSIDEVVERLLDRARTLPDKEWLLGLSWDQSLWPGKELPTHEPLSRALPDRPVWLTRVD